MALSHQDAELLERARSTEPRCWFVNRFDGQLLDAIGDWVATRRQNPTLIEITPFQARTFLEAKEIADRKACDKIGAVVDTPVKLPSACVVVPNFNRWGLLAGNAASLFRGKSYAGVELLVINDGPEKADGKQEAQIVQAAEAKGATVRTIHTGNERPRNGGFARNIGIRETDADVVVQVEPEIRHLGDTINAARLCIATSDDDVFACPSAHAFLKYGETEPTPDEWTYAIVCPCDCPGGFDSVRAIFHRAFGIKRSLMLGIGGYDEDNAEWGDEDNDLFGRLIDSGIRPVGVPEIIILHQWHETSYCMGLDPNLVQERARHNIALRAAGVLIRNSGKPWGGKPATHPRLFAPETKAGKPKRKPSGRKAAASAAH